MGVLILQIINYLSDKTHCAKETPVRNSVDHVLFLFTHLIWLTLFMNCSVTHTCHRINQIKNACQWPRINRMQKNGEVQASLTFKNLDLSGDRTIYIQIPALEDESQVLKISLNNSY